MSHTVRQYWWALQGRSTLNFNWDAIDNNSVVVITASEYRPESHDPRTSPRFVGAASITVENVSPHGPPFDGNRGVTFVVNVDWDSPLHVVTDITVLDAPQIVQWNGARLDFHMQHQLESNWCWAATSVSVAKYYQPSIRWTQCVVADRQVGRNDCCGSGASGPCNVSSVLDQPLSIVHHLDHMVNAQVDLATWHGQIDIGRPLCARIGWSGGGGHFIALIGYHSDTSQWVSVDDPFYGPSDVTLGTLQSAYQSTGSWTHSYFTKP